jgi:crotonobetainyl-CoA:carnitine CoA-transferase CaiB-like acyl-CoA transferase
VKNRELLESKINKLLENKTTSTAYKMLSEAGIPCAPVNTISEATENEQVIFREMILKMKTDYGNITIPGTPFKFSGTPGTIRTPPPSLGNGNEDILKNAGYSDEEIEEFYRDNVIFRKKTDIQE